jgi:hypothetical protein
MSSRLHPEKYLNQGAILTIPLRESNQTHLVKETGPEFHPDLGTVFEGVRSQPAISVSSIRCSEENSHGGIKPRLPICITRKHTVS